MKSDTTERISLSYSQLIVIALAHMVAIVAAVGISVFLNVPAASAYCVWLAVGWVLVGGKLVSPLGLEPGWDIVGAFRLVAGITCWPITLAK